MRKGSVKNTLYPSTLGRFCPAKRRMFWCLNLDFPTFPENDKYSLRSLISTSLVSSPKRRIQEHSVRIKFAVDF